MPEARHRYPNPVLRRHAPARERVPGMHGRTREGADARPGVLAQGRGRDGGPHRLRARAAQPQDGARVSRLVGRPVDGADPRTVSRDLRRQARALRAAGASRPRARAPARGPPHDSRWPDRRHRRRPGEGRQRPVRPRLLQVRALLQVRRRLRRPAPEHLRDHGGRPRLRRAHLDRIRRTAARVGVRVLRQLHRGVPDRRAHGQPRARATRVW